MTPPRTPYKQAMDEPSAVGAGGLCVIATI
jgi:hypothetical protein